METTMKPTHKRYLMTVALVDVVVFMTTAAQAADPPPSWKDTRALRTPRRRFSPGRDASPKPVRLRSALYRFNPATPRRRNSCSPFAEISLLPVVDRSLIDTRPSTH
jgi:hypothetical protein